MKYCLKSDLCNRVSSWFVSSLDLYLPYLNIFCLITVEERTEPILVRKTVDFAALPEATTHSGNKNISKLRFFCR